MIIIPARLASSRFDRKILATILGVPMFIKSALNAMNIDDVVLALDSEETMKIAQNYNIKAVLTDPNIKNGTLRVLSVAKILGLKNDEIIINLQADEPFLESSVINALKDSMKYTNFMSTCAKKITEEESLNPNLVKVLLDCNNDAIYFSRSKIPFLRDFKADIFLGHIGIYGFFKETLEEFNSLKETELENFEKLEQLRAIYYKKQIKVNIVESQSIGIDTQEDLNYVLNCKSIKGDS